MDVYAHGVGSSSGGDHYHHEVYHLVQSGVTLCGVRVRGDSWWNEWGVSVGSFSPANERPTGSPDRDEYRVCWRCSQKNTGV